MLDGKGMFSSFTTQEIASAALCNLAVNEQNRDEVAKEGAIPKLIQVMHILHFLALGLYFVTLFSSLGVMTRTASTILVFFDKVTSQNKVYHALKCKHTLFQHLILLLVMMWIAAHLPW